MNFTIAPKRNSLKKIYQKGTGPSFGPVPFGISAGIGASPFEDTPIRSPYAARRLLRLAGLLAGFGGASTAYTAAANVTRSRYRSAASPLSVSLNALTLFANVSASSVPVEGVLMPLR